MKFQQLTFCFLGPIISLTTVTTETFASTMLQRGINSALVDEFGRIIQRYFSFAFIILYLLAMLPALLSSWLFSKMLARAENGSAWGWLAASIAAMAVGPSLLAILIFNHPLGQAMGALVPAFLSVTVCGLVSRYSSNPTSQRAA
jgi:hypothetical protein